MAPHTLRGGSTALAPAPAGPPLPRTCTARYYADQTWLRTTHGVFYGDGSTTPDDCCSAGRSTPAGLAPWPSAANLSARLGAAGSGGGKLMEGTYGSATAIFDRRSGVWIGNARRGDRSAGGKEARGEGRWEPWRSEYMVKFENPALRRAALQTARQPFMKA